MERDTMVQKMLDGIKEETGKDVDEYVKIIKLMKS